MLLSSQTDFKYGEQTASSNPPGSPAGDGSSSRNYRNMLSNAVSGFVGSFTGGSGSGSDGRGSDRNPNERWNDNDRWSSNNERRNDTYRPPFTRWAYERSRDTKTHSYQLSREDLRDIALSTLEVLDEGEYFPPGQDVPYDLKPKIEWTDENTRYYGPDAGKDGEMLESEFIKIKEGRRDEGEDGRDIDADTGAVEKIDVAGSPREMKQADNQSKKAVTTAPEAKNNPTQIYVGEYSTLVGARRVHLGLAKGNDANKKIGVLNFASAKKPGGGFINGSQAQEESIARASTLFPSLITDAASQFYAHYHDDPGNAYYTHAMVYSPSVVLLRDDEGDWRRPVEVDVLTSAAVNAGEIRRDLEMKEKARRERVEKELWQKRGEERRKQTEKAAAERRRVMEEKAKVRKEKAEVAKLKREQAKLDKLQKKNGKETNERKATNKEEAIDEANDSDNENEELSVEQELVEQEQAEEEQVDAEVMDDKGKGKESKTEEPEGDHEEDATDGLESGSSYDDQPGKAEENAESNVTLTQDGQAQPEGPLKESATSSSALAHPLSSQTQPLQAITSDPDADYILAVSTAEAQIYQTMHDRISRILHLFQLHQTPYLILGSFGTGVFQNRIELIAAIFADLLIKPGGRFKDVFKTAVFAILGKDTVKVFRSVFSKIDKKAQKEGAKRCVFDDSGGDGDVGERTTERQLRMMRWKARKSALRAARDEADAAAFAAVQAADAAAYSTFCDEAYGASDPPFFDASADLFPGQVPYLDQVDPASYSPFNVPQAGASRAAASFAAAQADAAANPTSFDNVQRDGVFYFNTSAIRYPSFDVNQAPSFGATQAGMGLYPTLSTTQADAGADVSQAAFSTQVDPVHDILEDEKMVLTGDDEQGSGETANASIPPSKSMVVDDRKDIEMVETKSVPDRSSEAQNSSNDDDIDMH